MNYKVLKINLNNTDVNIFLDRIEGLFIENEIDSLYDINNDDKSIFIYKIDGTAKSLNDYIDILKLTKDLVIELITTEYKTVYSISEVKQEEDTNSDNLDNLIYKVPNNDEKLTDILNQLKSKGKK